MTMLDCRWRGLVINQQIAELWNLYHAQTVRALLEEAWQCLDRDEHDAAETLLRRGEDEIIRLRAEGSRTTG